MRFSFLLITLVALTLAACGGSSSTKGSADLSSPTAATPAQIAGASNGGSTTTTTTTTARPVPIRTRYVPPRRRLHASHGASPAVVLLADSKAAAAAEAGSLSRLGLGTLVVGGPSPAPAEASAFSAAVSRTLTAIGKLRRRAGVDPNRIGIIGQGLGAHIGAVAIGRAPSAITAAVLADIGGAAVPSPKFAPERWLQRATGTALLFQRDTAKLTMTPAQVKRLMIAAPPGTLMQDYKQLGSAAQKARDSWIKSRLLAG